MTGAQIPAGRLDSDARRNFVNAVTLATMDISGVYVVFGNRIILGSRAKKYNERDLDAFRSFNIEDIGEIGISIKLKPYRRPRHTKEFTAQPGFDNNITVFTLIPGFDGKYIDNAIDAGAKGLIIRAYGSGDIPYPLLPHLENARNHKVPVLVTTQCPQGVTQMGINDVGLQALKKGVIPVFDMSMESMSTKLRWLIGKKTPYEEMKNAIHKNLAGEIETLEEYVNIV